MLNRDFFAPVKFLKTIHKSIHLNNCGGASISQLINILENLTHLYKYMNYDVLNHLKQQKKKILNFFLNLIFEIFRTPINFSFEIYINGIRPLEKSGHKHPHHPHQCVNLFIFGRLMV